MAVSVQETVAGVHTDGRGRERARPLARVLGVLQSLATAVAGVAGAVVLLAALAPLVGLHLVQLQTGSMSPGFPAGSVLLERTIDAADVTPGDIVTVVRADGSPVTHRVVTVDAAGAGASLVLRGDANDLNDPQPYLATRVGLVIGGLPWGGSLIELARAPGAIPVLAVVASLLVLWAWWPTRRVPAHRASPSRGTKGRAS